MLHFQPHPQKDHRAPLVSDFLNLTGEKKNATQLLNLTEINFQLFH